MYQYIHTSIMGKKRVVIDWESEYNKLFLLPHFPLGRKLICTFLLKTTVIKSCPL